MIQCSFCDQPLYCSECGKPVRPSHAEAHTAVYQPDMEIICGHCGSIIVCKLCGFRYGDDESEEE